MIIREKDKQTLIQIFSISKLPIEVWAYGSRVNGTAHSGSDLDLVIVSSNKDKLPIDLYMELKEKIRDSNIPILVDLFDWARLPDSFHASIEAKHEVLFSNMQMIANEPPAEYNAD